MRDFQAVIGREVRHQCLEKMGGDPDILLACVGGGSNAIGLFHEFVDDAHVRLIGAHATTSYPSPNPSTTLAPPRGWCRLQPCQNLESYVHAALTKVLRLLSKMHGVVHITIVSTGVPANARYLLVVSYPCSEVCISCLSFSSCAMHCHACLYNPSRSSSSSWVHCSYMCWALLVFVTTLTSVTCVGYHCYLCVLPGVEAAGMGVDTDKHAATITKGTPGVLHGSFSLLLQDAEGQVIDPHSISAGYFSYSSFRMLLISRFIFSNPSFFSAVVHGGSYTVP